VSDLLDDAHARAGLDLLEANAALTVFDGVVDSPTPDPPFVLVYTTVEWLSGPDAMANSLDHLSETCRVTWVCHCVGLTAAASRAVVMQVRSSLLDQRPVIAGRVCGLISQTDVQAPVRDETTGRLVMDTVVTYELLTAPGA